MKARSPTANYQRILVVDDFEGFRLALGRMLEDQGSIKVDTAHSGEEALKLCRTRRYDAILSDFNLGMGKTGLQVLETLRFQNQLEPEQIFMLISAENNKHIILAATDVEPDAYVTKPITTKSLLNRLNRIFKQRRELKPLYQCLAAENWSGAIEICLDHIGNEGYYRVYCQKTLGELYLRTNNISAAKSLYGSILSQRPLDWARLGMVDVLYKMREFDQAEEALKSLIKDSPFLMKAYDRLYKVYQAQKSPLQQQEIIAQAVDVSPLSFARQSCLAETAVSNKDFYSAARAYKKIMRLAENSVYQAADQSLLYARVASALVSEDEALGLSFCKDAYSWMNKKSVVADDHDALRNNLIKTQLLVGLGKQSDAIQVFSIAERHLHEDREGVLFESEMEYVLALTALGKKEVANQQLVDLCVKYQSDEEKLQVLDDLLDEPISNKNKKIVAEINKTGINQYQQKNYTDAAKLFMDARRLFPKHLGIHLNLVQVLSEDMKLNGTRPDYLTEVEKSLSVVRSIISMEHQQYRRFIHLESEFNDVKRKL